MMATSIVKVHSGDKEKDTAPGRSAEKQWSGSALIGLVKNNVKFPPKLQKIEKIFHTER